MSKWGLKSYLERALAAWRAEDHQQGFAVRINGRDALLDEIHIDFLLVTYTNNNGHDQTAVPLDAIEEITFVACHIGAEQTTRSAQSLDQPDTGDTHEATRAARHPPRPLRPSAS